MTIMHVPANTSHPATLAGLARVLPRLVSWIPMGIALVAVVGIFAWRYDKLGSPEEGTIVLRATAVLISLAVLYVLDDASRNVTSASALTQRWRVGLRLALIAIVVIASVGVASMVVAVHTNLPGFWGGFALEVFTWVALGAAIALVLQNHFGMPEPGQIVSVALVMALVLMLALSARWPMFAMPGESWTPSHQRWGAVALVAVAVVIYELKDAAARWPNLGRMAVARRR